MSSSYTPDELRMTQSYKLNLFTMLSKQSRSTGGSNMPNKMQSKPVNQMSEVDVNEPELLPVSCGYFFNIVR